MNTRDESLGANQERVLLLVPKDGSGSRPDDEMSLAELVGIVWVRKWLVVTAFALCLSIAAAYAFLSPVWFDAEVTLIEANQTQAGLSTALGGLATISGLAGIKLPGESPSYALAILESHDFTRSFIQDLNLLPVLYSDKWDSKTGAWKGARENWPDIRDGVRLFERKVRRIEEDKTKGIVVLAVTWRDADTAANWANLLVDRLNTRVRETVIAESQRNVEFLRGELSSTTVVALQQSIARLMENEMQKMMSARGDSEYAFKVIDRAVPAKWKSSPKRLRILLVGGLVGLFVGFVMAYFLGARDKGARTI